VTAERAAVRSDGGANLDYLDAAASGLSIDHLHAMQSLLIGALSNHVPADQWRESVDLARRMLLIHPDATEARATAREACECVLECRDCSRSGHEWHVHAGDPCPVHSDAEVS
jgi:hypothetical protein